MPEVTQLDLTRVCLTPKSVFKPGCSGVLQSVLQGNCIALKMGMGGHVERQTNQTRNVTFFNYLFKLRWSLRPSGLPRFPGRDTVCIWGEALLHRACPPPRGTSLRSKRRLWPPVLCPPDSRSSLHLPQFRTAGRDPVITLRPCRGSSTPVGVNPLCRPERQVSRWPRSLER